MEALLLNLIHQFFGAQQQLIQNSSLTDVIVYCNAILQYWMSVTEIKFKSFSFDYMWFFNCVTSKA
ncbi:60S ribosomal protein L36-3-like [Iris pallida]|uniref:60S ribosomal protein L36-3-like n=1 Tax=Iris pallida TaxID=29817 RepID=A0AAX6HHN3_IRIPA|nr:60S ribosomal protein L36-3-like [Iris pallida]